MAFPEDVRGGKSFILYSGPRAAFDTNQDILIAFDDEPRFVSENVGGAPILDKAILSGFMGSMLAFCHGAAMCRAADLPVDLYSAVLWADIEDIVSRFTPMLGSRRYDETSEATVEVCAAAYDKVVSTSEALGVDAALPRLLKRCFERAIVAGHGEHELPAISEALTKAP